MSAITIASIETTVGNVFHTVAAEAAKIVSGLHLVVADIDKEAPLIEAVITAINPAAGAAAQAVIGIMNAVDTAVGTAESDVAAPVTVSLPAELVSLFKSARASVLAYEKTL